MRCLSNKMCVSESGWDIVLYNKGNCYTGDDCQLLFIDNMKKIESLDADPLGVNLPQSRFSLLVVINISQRGSLTSTSIDC